MKIAARGVDLFCIRLGQGVPVLTMHGAGFDHSMLRPWLDPLADTYQLIYYDQRGSGRSRQADLSDVTNETWVADADAIRQALGIDRVVVFGHSYGGCLAQEYVLAHPDHVRAVILCSTMPTLDYPHAMMANARARGTPEQFEAVKSGFSAPLKSDEAFRRIWEQVLPLYFHSNGSAMSAFEKSPITLSAAAFNRAFFACLPGFNTLARLRQIEVPTLVIAGRSDWITPHDWGAMRLTAGIPDATLKIFDWSGHFPFVEQQDAFLMTVREWLQTAH